MTTGCMRTVFGVPQCAPPLACARASGRQEHQRVERVRARRLCARARRAAVPAAVGVGAAVRTGPGQQHVKRARAQCLHALGAPP
eukprot:655708-Pleurochrysis_carterae.AAC.1